MSGSRRDLIVPAVLVAAAALATGPLLIGRGYALLGDMSFVPEQPWKPAWLGLDGSAPRAVPADAIVSLASAVVPGDLLQKVLLFGVLVAVGWGTARLVRDLLGVTSLAAQAAAGVLALWNPYVHERLAIGHWGLLLGYAALPWVALAAAALRRGVPGATPRLVLALAPACLFSPTGGLLAGAVALTFVIGRDAGRRTGIALGCVLVLNLPWLVPGLTGAEAGNDPGGVEAFAARSDSPFGLLGSLLTLGGIWKGTVVPEERGNWFLVLIALAASVCALALLARDGGRARGTAGRGERTRLLALAGLGLVLAVLPATAPGADLVRAVVEHVPGGGLFRDSQKWLALTALGVAAGFGLVLARVADGVRSLRLPARPFQLALVALPVVVLPSLAWGLSGDLDPVRYPPDWGRVRAILADQPEDERSTVVLPFSAYQRYTWNDGRAALDPAIRYLPGRVLTNDELVVGDDEAVAGDSGDAAAVAAAIRAGERLEPVLAEVGVRFALVQHAAAGAAGVEDPAGRVVYDGADLRLIDLGNEALVDRGDGVGAIVAADLLCAGTLVVSGSFLAFARIRRRSVEMG